LVTGGDELGSAVIVTFASGAEVFHQHLFLSLRFAGAAQLLRPTALNSNMPGAQPRRRSVGQLDDPDPFVGIAAQRDLDPSAVRAAS
jgi:hypothetical protein